METDEILNKETGEKELETLKPARVKIMDVHVVEVGEKKNKKLNCMVKHPNKNEVISISSIKLERKGKLEIVGLWINLDEDKNIQKGSALSILMEFLKAKTPKELEQKEIDTILDDKGYLSFKAY